jgi:hypothetical protein
MVNLDWGVGKTMLFAINLASRTHRQTLDFNKKGAPVSEDALRRVARPHRRVARRKILRFAKYARKNADRLIKGK